jgi:hypothetical protein
MEEQGSNRGGKERRAKSRSEAREYARLHVLNPPSLPPPHLNDDCPFMVPVTSSLPQGVGLTPTLSQSRTRSPEVPGGPSVRLSNSSLPTAVFRMRCVPCRVMVPTQRGEKREEAGREKKEAANWTELCR